MPMPAGCGPGGATEHADAPPERTAEERERRLARAVREGRNTIVVTLISGKTFKCIVESPEHHMIGLCVSIGELLDVHWWCVDLVRHDSTVVAEDADILDFCGQSLTAVVVLQILSLKKAHPHCGAIEPDLGGSVCPLVQICGAIEADLRSN